jgi:SAM-dependent methyltransferase
MEIKTTKNDCRVCPYFDLVKNNCSITEGSPIRKCVIAINKELVKELAPKIGTRVLEIGCGAWSYLKDNLPININWEGIDPVAIDAEGRKTIATKIGSVEKIPFSAESFDYVLANQSIEHWFEYGVTFKKALAEISRVLKVGGIFWINMPFFVHGHKMFFTGQEEKALRLFSEKNWEILKIEKWRANPEPLALYQPWKEDSFYDCLGKKYDNATAYQLNLIIRKKAELKMNFLDEIASFFAKIISPLFPKKVLYMINYGPVMSARILKNKLR